MYYNKVNVDSIQQVDIKSFSLAKKERSYCLIYILYGNIYITINSNRTYAVDVN